LKQRQYRRVSLRLPADNIGDRKFYEMQEGILMGGGGQLQKNSRTAFAEQIKIMHSGT